MPGSPLHVSPITHLVESKDYEKTHYDHGLVREGTTQNLINERLYRLLLTSHQEPSPDTLWCSHPHTFTEVKSSFFILQSNSGACLFNSIRYSWRPQRILKFIRVYCKKKKKDRGSDIFGFRWVRGNFETLCNGAAKVLKDCERVLQSKEPESRLVGELSLHVASIQNGGIPHLTCKYKLNVTFFYVNSLNPD